MNSDASSHRPVPLDLELTLVESERQEETTRVPVDGRPEAAAPVGGGARCAR